jgi:H+/Cl- antiporter ClcA
MASVGFVAVFAGASNTPLACAIMGVELFGGGGAIYLIVGCVVAYLTSGHRGIYGTQRIDTPKYAAFSFDVEQPLNNQKRRGISTRR